MKTTLTILLVLSLFVLPLNVSASAKYEDSLSISSEVRNTLAVPENKKVVRLYNDYAIWAIADGFSMEEVLSDASVSYIYPSDDSGNKDGFAHKEIIEGNVEDDTLYYGDTCEFYYNIEDKHDRILATLGNDVKAEKIYYINSRHIGSDQFIYYVTNKGEYILYKSGWGQTEDEEDLVFLLPLDEFRTFAKPIAESRALLTMGSGGVTPVPAGLEAYQITLPTDNRISAILLWGIPVVLVAGGLGVFVFSKKRKKEKPTTSDPD